MTETSEDVRRTRVATTDGIELAVTSRGDRSRPTIVAIHGYPDNQTVWDGIAAHLVDDFHVVTYDVRGAGESDKPGRRRDYRIPQLSADLGAVIDATSPDAPVHLLAHDWGSIQTWASVTDANFADRIASYTSISGPSLDMAGKWLRANVRPDGTKLRNLSYQLVESYYVFLFQVPVLPEALWRTGIADRVLDFTGKIGQSDDEETAGYADVDRSQNDRINGIALYRANALPHLLRPKPHRTEVPVQVIAPERDPYVSKALQTEAPEPYVEDLRIVTIDGGHWVVVEQPALIASLTTEFIHSL